MAVLLVVLLGSVGSAMGQTQDERLWLGAGVDAGLGPKLEVGAEQQLRVGVDAGFDETHTQLEVQWTPIAPLRLGALYRFALRDGESRHRVAGSAEAVARVQRIRLRYRLRLQATTRPADDARIELRNRGRVDVRVKPWARPFVAIELHHLLSPNSEYRELRFYLGVDWRLSKKVDLTSAYLYQEESNVAVPEQNHILIVGLAYHLGDLRATEADAAGD